MALLEVTNLVVHYGKALALEGVSLSVESGELVGVLGPNGAGKTTLLKAISRTLPSSAGHIAFNGASLDGLPAHEVVGHGICHCPEGRRLFPELSVWKNLMLGAYLRRDKEGIEQDLERVYALFPVLTERRRQQASTLSGGQQQMLAVGRALMGRPILLLLDEPSVGIAHRLKMEIFQSIRAIRAAGTAVLLVEQDAGATLAVADRVYVMEHGKFAREGKPQELAEWERSNTMEEIVEKPASIADLERLEADIEEALISHIDKPADESIIADLERRKFLERRKLHLICEIERLRRQYCVPSLH